jgi:hypothetical protein
VQCTTGPEIKLDLRAAGFELGETAWAFRAPDDRALAVSIVGVDGGEDTSEFTLDTVVIDIATSCRDRKATMWTSQDQELEVGPR